MNFQDMPELRLHYAYPALLGIMVVIAIGMWKYFTDHRKLYRIALYQGGNEVELIMGPEDPIYYE